MGKSACWLGLYIIIIMVCFIKGFFIFADDVSFRMYNNNLPPPSNEVTNFIKRFIPWILLCSTIFYFLTMIKKGDD